jgi:glutamate/tyrosine decarboxylase-like PLP-dependent enzyme
MNQPLPVSEANRLLQQLFSGQAADISQLPASSQALLEEANRQRRADRAAHMTPQLAPYSLLGMQLAGLHQGNLLSAALYPELKQAESDSLDWLKSLFDLPYAQFSHGGSYNNLQALWQARDRDSHNRRTVYASQACHYSIAKACRILGLELQLIETDDREQMLINKLAKACTDRPPLAIVLTAGTPVSGGWDPLEAALELARKTDSWVHIDAAWGGALWTLETSSLRAVSGQVDSLGFDPHKALFQPRPCSVYFSLHDLSATQETAYLSDAPKDRLAGSHGAELFLPLWLNLQLLGEHWFADQTRQRLAQADLFARQLSPLTDGFVVNNGNGIICFSAPEGALHTLVAEGVLSYARLNGRDVYRVVFTSSATRADALIARLRPFL